MHNTELMLMELLKEIGQSNRALSLTLKKTLQLAEDHQTTAEALQPIAIEIYSSLNRKSEWTEEEIYWHQKLREALTGRKE